MFIPYDLSPISSATLADLSRAVFEDGYLPAGFADTDGPRCFGLPRADGNIDMMLDRVEDDFGMSMKKTGRFHSFYRFYARFCDVYNAKTVFSDLRPILPGYPDAANRSRISAPNIRSDRMAFSSTQFFL